MRVDDEYVVGGELRGLYGADGDKGAICHDFLLFCKLAVAHQVRLVCGRSLATAAAAAAAAAAA
jgi:hypothetical protein